MTKLKLISVTRYANDKDGNPLKTKDGRLYTRLVIGAEGYEKTLSGFDGKETKDWAVGSEVEVEVEQKGDYLNFRVPKKDDKTTELIETIKFSLSSLHQKIDEIGRAVTKRPTEAVPYPEENIKLEDMPF